MAAILSRPQFVKDYHSASGIHFTNRAHCANIVKPQFSYIKTVAWVGHQNHNLEQKEFSQGLNYELINHLWNWSPLRQPASSDMTGKPHKDKNIWQSVLWVQSQTFPHQLLSIWTAKGKISVEFSIGLLQWCLQNGSHLVQASMC